MQIKFRSCGLPTRAAFLCAGGRDMKFIKHFTDAHRGKSMRLLLKKFGPAGIGRYWILVELCAEKMTKGKDEEFTEKHCVFEFERSYLSTSLGFGNLHQCSTYLAAMADLGLCSVEEGADLCRCSMPKLLECLDRDTKRARTERAPTAPKKKKIKKKSSDEIEISILSGQQLLLLFDQETKSEFLTRYKTQVFLDACASDCVAYYHDRPDKLPRTERGWRQAYRSWLKREVKFNPLPDLGVVPAGSMRGA